MKVKVQTNIDLDSEESKIINHILSENSDEVLCLRECNPDKDIDFREEVFIPSKNIRFFTFHGKEKLYSICCKNPKYTIGYMLHNTIHGRN